MNPLGRSLARIAALAACGCLTTTSAEAQPPPQPHLAVFADGAEVPGTVADIADLAKAKIAGRALFDPAKPVRLVRLAAAVPRQPDAFVEMDNGDRLPGTVLGHDPEGTVWRTLPPAAMPMNHAESCPATLVVAVTNDVTSGAIRVGQYRRVADSGLVRVRRDRVRRIAWKHDGGRPFQPRTMFLADGTAVAYRSLRWTDDGVIALLEDGTTQRHPLESLVELHLAPASDPWNPWFDSLVNDAGLVTIETLPGVRATTPRTRYRAAPGIAAPTIMIQPSWSLEPLFITIAAVARMVYLPATDPPLTWLAPSRVVQRSAFGGSWKWQLDRNVYGGPLHAAGPPAAWGFGVQARTELAFPLPAGVQGFRGTVGLDRAVRGGGCIRATVHLENAGAPPVWDSGLLIGSGTLADCGTIPLQGPPAGQKEIVLVVDDAHRDRPQGADPFDIRDAADWIDPRFVLDPTEVKARLAARLAAAVPALVGWQVETAPGGTTRAIDAIDPLIPQERAGWGGTTVTEGGPLRLSREWPSLRPDDANLVIAVSTVGAAKGAIELQVDDWRWELPLVARAAATAVPFVLPLADRPAGPLRVELVVPPGLPVQWHAIAVTGPLDSEWFPLEPVTMESSGGSTFRQREDGATLVSMPPPDNDAYTLRLRSPKGGIRALRIDGLTDPSLAKPHYGPGRAPTNGVVRTSALAVSSVTGDERTPVEIVAAFADPLPNAAYAPMEAVRRNPQAWWHGEPAVRTSAVFHFRADTQAADEVVLDLEYRANHREAKPMSLGCFRVYGSPEPDARLPVTNITHLVRQPDPPNAPARKTIVGAPLAEPPKP